MIAFGLDDAWFNVETANHPYWDVSITAGGRKKVTTIKACLPDSVAPRPLGSVYSVMKEVAAISMGVLKPMPNSSFLAVTRMVYYDYNRKTFKFGDGVDMQTFFDALASSKMPNKDSGIFYLNESNIVCFFADYSDRVQVWP